LIERDVDFAAEMDRRGLTRDLVADLPVDLAEDLLGDLVRGLTAALFFFFIAVVPSVP